MTYQDHVHELIDDARARLASPLDDRDVHALRLTCKRLRAAWQLQRVDSPKVAVKTREATAKAIAKSLEGSREARVRDALLGWLMPRVSPAYRPLLAKLRAALVAADDEGSVAADRQMLEEEFDRERQLWENSPLTPRQVRKGLKLTRGKVRRLARRSAKRRDVELCHRWRKWVKYRMYQQAMHQRVEGKSPQDSPKRLKRIGKRLGRQHDLANLALWLEAQAVDESLIDEIHDLAEGQLDKALMQGGKLGWLR